MLFIFFCILLIGTMGRSSSRLLRIAAWILAFLVSAFAFLTGDQQTYESSFYYLSNVELLKHYEPLFAALMVAVKAAGLPYGVFRLLFSILYLGFLACFLSKATGYDALARVLLFLFPTMYFSSVMRSGLACGIVLLSLWKLSERKKHARIRYLFGILIATMFHYSSAFFFLLVFLDLKQKINYSRLAKCFAAMLLVWILMFYTSIPYQLVSLITKREKTLQWFVRGSASLNLTGTIVLLTMLLGNTVLTRYANQICRYPSAKLILTKKQIWLSSCSEHLAAITMFCLPLYVFAAPFVRIPYMVYPALLCSWLNAAKIVRVRQKIVFPVLLIGAVGMTFLWRVHVDLPYWKAGAPILGELFHFQFVFH